MLVPLEQIFSQIIRSTGRVFLFTKLTFSCLCCCVGQFFLKPPNYPSIYLTSGIIVFVVVLFTMERIQCFTTKEHQKGL